MPLYVNHVADATLAPVALSDDAWASFSPAALNDDFVALTEGETARLSPWRVAAEERAIQHAGHWPELASLDVETPNVDAINPTYLFEGQAERFVAFPELGELTVASLDLTVLELTELAADVADSPVEVAASTEVVLAALDESALRAALVPLTLAEEGGSEVALATAAPSPASQPQVVRLGSGHDAVAPVVLASLGDMTPVEPDAADLRAELEPLDLALADEKPLPDAQVRRIETPAPAPVAPPAAEDKPVATENLAEAIMMALNENPDIQIAKTRQDDAYYGIMESRAGFLPKLDLALSAGPEYNLPGGQSSTTEVRREGTVTLRQNVWDFGLTLNELRRAKALYESAEWATRERIESIAFEIASAYIGVLERERVVELTVDNVKAHEKILRMVSTQKELGLATGADVSRVQARLSNVQAALMDRESERDQAKENYRRLVKRLPARVTDPPGAESSLPQNADDAVDMIDMRSPKLMQSMSDRKSLVAQRRSQIGNYYPRIEVEVQGNWKEQVQGDTGRNRDSRAMVVMRYNLFNGMADYAVSKRIGARIREVDYEIERVRREVEQDVRSDFRALDAARSKVATVNDEVSAAQRVVELYVEQFKTGKRSAFDLLDSQQALVQAQSNQIANRYQATISGYRVLQKLGLLFDHVSATPHSKI